MLACTHACVYTCLRVHMLACTHACVYTCLRVHLFACTRAHVCQLVSLGRGHAIVCELSHPSCLALCATCGALGSHKDIQIAVGVAKDDDEDGAWDPDA
jgi:hypothetical protein